MKVISTLSFLMILRMVLEDLTERHCGKKICCNLLPVELEEWLYCLKYTMCRLLLVDYHRGATQVLAPCYHREGI